MPDEPDNIVLVFLRRLDEKVDRLSEDMSEVKQRIGACEAAIVRVQGSLDRLTDRVQRIERRLDLAPTA
jgi:hypothetical protein